MLASKVPFLDLKKLNERYRKSLEDACKRVLDSGWYLQAEELKAFEKEFAGYCTADYAIGVGNGLDALNLILRALDIGEVEEWSMAKLHELRDLGPNDATIQERYWYQGLRSAVTKCRERFQIFT